MIYNAQVQFISNGIVVVKAENEEDAMNAIINDFGLTINNFHTSNDESIIDWEFSMHPDKSIVQIKPSIEPLEDTFDSEPIKITKGLFKMYYKAYLKDDTRETRIDYHFIGNLLIKFGLNLQDLEVLKKEVINEQL
jgi:hypothetical protein